MWFALVSHINVALPPGVAKKVVLVVDALVLPLFSGTSG